jgi:pilus assembly protein CpaF
MALPFRSQPHGEPLPRSELKSRVHQRLVESLDLTAAQRLPVQELRDECLRRVDSLLSETQTPLTTSEKQLLLREVMDEIFGLGPIEELMRDPAVTDILVNGHAQLYVERGGRLELTAARFRDDKHVLQVIQRIAAGVGRRIDESSPMLDARLADGSRVNAIIPPLALGGPAMSVRRFAGVRIDADRMADLGSWTRDMSRFLEAAVRCRANILVAGGTGTGKTTLLNVLSKWIPPGERVITIEDAAELNLQRDHVVALETRPPNIEGKGEVTQRELLKNTLRMRPDRILIGEVRGAECLDMLQAMNTGHEGSMTTVHANSPRDALRRLENMVAMSGMNWPVHVIRDQMANTLDLVVHAQRMTGGRRRVTSIVEVCGMERDVILTQEIFRFRQDGVDKEGHATGQFEGCGVRPRLLDRMLREGLDVPPTLFNKPLNQVSGRLA